MKRQLIVVGVTAFALLLLAFISATLAAPENRPCLQIPQENEPNDDWNHANVVNAPGSITGQIWNSITDTDYFVMYTEVGREYEAKLTINSPQGLKLEMVLYDSNQDTIKTSSSSDSSTSMLWSASTITYYVQVAAVVLTDTYQTADYSLQIRRLAAEPTETPTPTPSPANADAYEPNNGSSQAYTLPVQTSVTLNLTFHTSSDKDWFKVWGKNGKWYQATTSDLSGVDTYMEIHNQNNGVVETDDDGAGGYASQAAWQASYDGYYYVYIRNKVNDTGSYKLTVEESSAPPAGPTSTPSNPASGADSCEDNSDFEYACVIATNDTQTFNFYPPYGGTDNDFFKLWVKPGFIYDCRASVQDPGIDPNMIVFTGPSWDEAIGGNDDVEIGNPDSFFSYYATYEGWLYVLVGTGDRTPSNVSESDYELNCEMKVPGQPTATSTPGPTNTPRPGATATPTEAAAGLTVRPLTTPTPVPATTPSPRFVPISLLVYYDGNDDRQPGAGEGIAGVSVQVYEAATSQLLTQDFTDELGNLDFTVSAQGPVRVSVPFFGFSQLVAGEGASIYLRIPSQSLPGETP